MRHQHHSLLLLLYRLHVFSFIIGWLCRTQTQHIIYCAHSACIYTGQYEVKHGQGVCKHLTPATAVHSSRVRKRKSVWKNYDPIYIYTALFILNLFGNFATTVRLMDVFLLSGDSVLGKSFVLLSFGVLYAVAIYRN